MHSHGTDAAYRRYYVTNFAGDLTDASPDAGATCNALLQWDLMTSAYANYVVPVYWDSTPYGTTEWMWGHL